jgi:hypothetical protein
MPKFSKILFGLILMGPVLTGHAQPSASPTPQGEPGGEPLDISIAPAANLSPEEMLGQARAYRQRMDETLKEIKGRVDEAQKGKDVIRLNCLIEKQNQTVASIGVADDSIKSLEAANAASDKGAAAHEFTRITIIIQKVKGLGGEAESCLGEETSYVGETKGDVTGAPPGEYTGPTSVEPGRIVPPPVMPPPASTVQ